MRTATYSVARILALWMLAIPAALSAEPAAPSAVTVTNAWARPSFGTVAAAYFTLNNPAPEAERLVSVSCTCAKSAEIHRSSMTDGIMEMRPVDGLDLPAHGSADLSPGGSHLMLIGLAHPLKAGEQIVLTLHFAKTAPVMLLVPVGTPKPSADEETGQDMPMDRMLHR